MASSNVKSTLHATPVPGIPLLPPTDIPAPDHVILGYLVISPDDQDKYSRADARYVGAKGAKYWHKPDPAKMNARGWLGVLAGLVFFWPVSCVPCFLSCSYSAYQVPVYGPAAGSQTDA